MRSAVLCRANTRGSTDTAIALVKKFAREMGQPWDPAAHIPGDLWGPEHIPQQPTK